VSRRLGLVAVVCLSACHGAGTIGLAVVPCGEVSTCPNDPPPTQADKDTCTAEAASPCGGEYQTFHDCYGDERVCAYNGTTDVAATQDACDTESEAVYACLARLDAGTD
jgi:hypothetical protein